ncbi:MAG TPA: phenylalanine--tRNA ligase beta subunit-related protein [Anaerolineae bacterium]|jgi:DNA/RNA-binding domain of Phe-tRNA-synthetase-like protein|nr:phenylalanine--tRNA ligase beta subunit-related protein [Anaerolineae bacterium]
MFRVSDAWKAAFPAAHAGILAMHAVTNPPYHAELEEHKRQLQDQLRARFSGQDRSVIASLATIQAYNAYYKSFKKTYHVQLQLESIALKGKSLPSVAALVEAMFMAEIKNLLLTAGHDLDTLQLPITLDVATGQESYTLLRGQEQVSKPGDMLMTDQPGIISSVLYGPDQRTQITADTRRVLFAVYAPPGIEAATVLHHLEDIRQYVWCVSPEARVDLLEVFGAP